MLLREAIAALRGKQLARAEAAARQLVAHDPDSAVAAAALAESLPAGHPEERQRLDEAVERMDCPAIGPLERTARALSDHWRRPHGTRLVHRWLKLLQRQGLDDAQLLQATCRATELCPADMTCWTYHGQALAEIPDHRAAIEAYSRAIELYEEQQPITSGSYTVMWFNRACERAITGDAEGAFADLREAVRRDPRWIAEARADDYFDRVREDPRFDEALRAGEEFESFDPATPMHPVCEAAWRALQRARERGTSEPELVEALGYALAGAVEILEELVDLRVAVAQRDEAVTMSRLLFGRLQQGHLGLEGFFRLLGPYLGAPAA
ncbi:MAG: TPR end-of-group domain-containing protein [Gemmatimonadota bacterium]